MSGSRLHGSLPFTGLQD